MTVRERMLTIRVMEKAKRDPGYAKQLGIVVNYGKRKKKEGCK